MTKQPAPITQGDSETRTRTINMTIPAGATLTAATVHARAALTGIVTTWGAASGASIVNGNVQWTIQAGDLPVGTYTWWVIATINDVPVIPDDVRSGELTIIDR